MILGQLAAEGIVVIHYLIALSLVVALFMRLCQIFLKLILCDVGAASIVKIEYTHNANPMLC